MIQERAIEQLTEAWEEVKKKWSSQATILYRRKIYAELMQNAEEMYQLDRQLEQKVNEVLSDIGRKEI